MTRSSRPVAVTAMVCGVQHGVAEQDQHQRWRHDDAERAGHGDDGGAARQREPRGGEPRLDDPPQGQHAGANRTVHRPEQAAEHDTRDRGRRRPRQHGEAATVERFGERQAIDQRAHQHIKRNGLQQVVVEQIDQTFGQDAEELNWHVAAYGPHRGAEAGNRQQHHGRGEAGKGDAETDQQQQAQAQPRHHRDHCGCGVRSGRNSPITPSIRINDASSSNAILTMK